MGTINAHVLTEKKAIHLRALKDFQDERGVERRAGEEWLITLNVRPHYHHFVRYR